MTVTALDPAARALRETSSEALLDSLVQLTILVHAVASKETADEFREQRDMVRAEVLRRIGARS